MIPDTLYDLAMKFRKTKLWTKLYDSQLFAVRHSDGTIGYCSVMGKMGQYLAFAEFPGDKGLAAYRKMGLDRSLMDVFDNHETMLAQDCLMLSFNNKADLRESEVAEVQEYVASHKLSLRGKDAYPRFERFRPHHYPWRLYDETDQQHLAESLEAALDVAERVLRESPEQIGLVEGLPYERSIPLLEKIDGAFVWGKVELGLGRKEIFGSPRITDQLLLDKLSACKKRSEDWACDIFMHPEPMTDEGVYSEADEEPVNAPVFPYVLLIVDPATHLVLAIEVCKDLDDPAECIAQLVGLALEAGKPPRILVANERAHAFFLHIAPALGAKLVKRKHLPVLQEAREDYSETCREPAIAEFDEGMDDLLSMISDPDVYEDMPSGVLAVLSRSAEAGLLPDDVIALVRSECKKRGM